MCVQCQGMADGLGGAVPYKKIIQLQMIPEVVKADCSIIGAWGPSINPRLHTIISHPSLTMCSEAVDPAALARVWT